MLVEAPLLLTRKQVCTLTGWSRETVRRLRRAGRLTAKYLPGGHKARYLRTEVEAYLKGD